MINLMRQKVKSFLHVFINSLLPQSHYYKTVLKTKFSFSFKYLVSLILILNAILIIIGVSFLNPLTINDLVNSLSNSLQNYPKSLTIIINKGRLMTTYNQPYFLWLNYQNKTTPLLVIDETALPQKINEYSSSILLTSNYAVIKNMDIQGGFDTIPLSYFPSQVVNKTMISEVEANLQVIKTFLFPLYALLLLIVIIVLPLISLAVTLAYILIASALVYLFFKVWGKSRDHFRHIHYKKIVHVSFHAVTLPILVDYALGLLGARNLPISFLFFFLLFLFIFAWVHESYHR